MTHLLCGSVRKPNAAKATKFGHSGRSVRVLKAIISQFETRVLVSTEHAIQATFRLSSLGYVTIHCKHH